MVRGMLLGHKGRTCTLLHQVSALRNLRVSLSNRGAVSSGVNNWKKSSKNLWVYCSARLRHKFWDRTTILFFCVTILTSFLLPGLTQIGCLLREPCVFPFAVLPSIFQVSCKRRVSLSTPLIGHDSGNGLNQMCVLLGNGAMMAHSPYTDPIFFGRQVHLELGPM
jgi:hypothetical protein